MGADEALGDLVQLGGADARADRGLERFQGGHQDQPGMGHLLDLGWGLPDDHRIELSGCSELLLQSQRGDRGAHVGVDLVGATAAVDAA